MSNKENNNYYNNMFDSYSNPFGYLSQPSTPSRYSSNPFASQRRLKQQHAMEMEQQRRQRYYQQQQQSIRRQQLEEQQRLRAARELERRNQQQHQMMMAEQERRRKEEKNRRMLRQQQQQLKKQQRAESSYPPGTIVRGPDGRLYRIVGAPPQQQQQRKNTKQYDEIEARRCSESSLDSIYSSESSDESGDDHARVKEESDLMSCEESFVKENARANVQQQRQQRRQQVKQKNHDSASMDIPLTTSSQTIKQVTIPRAVAVVEDVPYEEDEELNELHSVWRNRQPSPGNWMEPVDSFDG
jgi:hypothetical protein